MPVPKYLLQIIPIDAILFYRCFSAELINVPNDLTQQERFLHLTQSVFWEFICAVKSCDDVQSDRIIAEILSEKYTANLYVFQLT